MEYVVAPQKRVNKCYYKKFETENVSKTYLGIVKKFQEDRYSGFDTVRVSTEGEQGQIFLHVSQPKAQGKFGDFGLQEGNFQRDKFPLTLLSFEKDFPRTTSESMTQPTKFQLKCRL